MIEQAHPRGRVVSPRICPHCGEMRADKYFCTKCLRGEYDKQEFMQFLTDFMTQAQQAWMDAHLQQIGDVVRFDGYSIRVIEFQDYDSVRFAVDIDEGSPLLNLDGILDETRESRRYRFTIGSLLKLYPPVRTA